MHRECIIKAYEERQQVEKRYAEGKERVLSICEHGASDSNSTSLIVKQSDQLRDFLYTVRCKSQAIYAPITSNKVRDFGPIRKEEHLSACQRNNAIVAEQHRYWMPEALQTYYKVEAGPQSVSVSCRKREVRGVGDEITALGCAISVQCYCSSGQVHEIHQVHNLTLSYRRFHACYVSGFVMTEFLAGDPYREIMTFSEKFHLPPFVLGVGTSEDDREGFAVCTLNRDIEWINDKTKQANLMRTDF